MGVLDTGDVITLLAAVAALVVCVWVGSESVMRVRGHRFDHPSVLLGAEAQEEEHALRHGFLERRYALVEAAGARVRAGVRAGPPDAGGDGEAPDPERSVEDLDRDLARLDSEEKRFVERTHADFADRLERAERRRATAWWLDVACVGAAALIAGGSMAAAVAALF